MSRKNTEEYTDWSDPDEDHETMPWDFKDEKSSRVMEELRDMDPKTAEKLEQGYDYQFDRYTMNEAYYKVRMTILNLQEAFEYTKTIDHETAKKAAEPLFHPMKHRLETNEGMTFHHKDVSPAHKAELRRGLELAENRFAEALATPFGEDQEKGNLQTDTMQQAIGDAMTAMSGDLEMGREIQQEYGTAYPAELTMTEEREFMVTFRDLPECTTSGGDLDEAIKTAEGTLAEALASRESDGAEIPTPSEPEEAEVSVTARAGA